MFCIYLAVISVAVTNLGVTHRQRGFYPLIIADSITVSLCSSVLFVCLILK